ncbi:hypothetical protein ACFO25_09985 [Paenactinomyces guangxiensis]|uniref:Uncharacterized protein n=1 Tax=Paenactinomyces guangxiensis TaxID=1490290 RepID=A0A7W1WS82_9BACL|nr:hypothetical protein [Paenactinomyces guangxiensis]MBA4495114.1 hypothetical protein [Paenactinomyces guangxiensis]MBH8592202.1 hypothetical protein [Paenactinomyces guangxiensis]
MKELIIKAKGKRGRDIEVLVDGQPVEGLKYIQFEADIEGPIELSVMGYGVDFLNGNKTK